MSERVALKSAREALRLLRTEDNAIAHRPDTFEVTPSEFCISDEYLGLDGDPYPHTLETLDEFCLGDWPEGVLMWGIGSGKTYLARLFLMYMAAAVLWEMRSGVFWDKFDLAYGSTVELGCFAPTYGAAHDVMYEGMRPLMLESPWFQRNFPLDPNIRSRIRFTRQSMSGGEEYWPLRIEPKGGSQWQRLGRNLFAVAVDETEFFLESAGKMGDQAQELIDEVSARIRSRFGDRGKLLMVSSANHSTSVCMRQLERAEEAPEQIYAQRYATWEVKPLERWPSGECCDVTVENAAGNELILEGVPVELKPEFDRNPQRALRDFGSIPSEALEPFDPAAKRIFNEASPPAGRGPALLPDWRPDNFYRVPDWVTPEASLATGVYDCEWGVKAVDVWFIHIDLALTGDAAGLALSHPVWLPQVEEEDAPAPWGVVLDWTYRICAQEIPDATEIDLNSIRGIVLQLKRRGFRIGMVSFDGFQSADSRQLLRRAGLRTDLVSVDRNADAYNELKELLHTGRLYYGDGYWLSEYPRLELVRGNKVDHRAGESKDVADAVAGSATHATHWLRMHEWGRTPAGDEKRTEQDVDSKLAEQYDIDGLDEQLAEQYADQLE
jgi:hypothetical protein